MPSLRRNGIVASIPHETGWGDSDTRQNDGMTTGKADFDLTMQELQVVALYCELPGGF